MPGHQRGIFEQETEQTDKNRENVKGEKNGEDDASPAVVGEDKVFNHRISYVLGVY